MSLFAVVFYYPLPCHVALGIVKVDYYVGLDILRVFQCAVGADKVFVTNGDQCIGVRKSAVEDVAIVAGLASSSLTDDYSYAIVLRQRE